METFDGLFICATNFIEQLDPAAMRRFSLKLAFKPLQAEQVVSLFAACCERMCDPKPSVAEQGRLGASLQRLTALTPADFASAAGRWELLDRSPTPDELVEALRQESALKPGGNRQGMGF